MHALAIWTLDFCRWCNGSFFGHTIRDSAWLFPFVEVFHLLALGLLGGILVMLNLSLMGVRFGHASTRELARELRPWLRGCIVVMLLSGFLLFSTEAVKLYGNWAFQLKMICLLLALLFTATLHRRVLDRPKTGAPVRALTALVSLLLWLGVGLGGRAIGYVTTAASAVAGS
ncbi:MAG TPA: DUF6644 family protein [Steroidobacteraceae bacterium]|jgi:hypothetical protein|nr:DUF6644 family protein [Steroidobacteraceae bacterium]